MRFAITSAIAWTAVLAAYFACITASDDEWAYGIMRVFKILSATMFIWYVLVAITSKGADRFAVGYAVSFIAILLLASMHHFDVARPFDDGHVL